LETGVGKCADFSDLFVALLRTNKIPAKVIKGMTMDASDNKTFHQWAEAYSRTNGWIMFDPTTQHMSIYKEDNEYKLKQKNKYIILSQKGYDTILGKSANSFCYAQWKCTQGTTVKRKVKFIITEK
jgi:transglutaminase-like putative cysteine protease